MSSLFGKLFGAPAPAPRPDPTAATAVAIQRIQTAKDMLEKKSVFLEKKIMQELVEAKKCGTKNKQKAILHLKRKARYLKQQQAIQGQVETLDSQIGALEMAATTNEVVDALATGKAAMDANYKDVDKVHDLIDDVNEQMQAINETTDALSTPIGDRVDEDDLLKELEELEQEDLDAKLSEVTPSSVELPSVPTTAMPAPAGKVPAAKKQEKDELDELSAWAL